MPEKLHEVAGSIKFDAIQYHLLHSNWTERESAYSNLSLFYRVRDGEEWSIRVPKARKNPDLYCHDMTEAIAILAEYNGSDPLAVATILKQERVDLHRIHIPPAPSNETTASLNFVKKAVNSFSNLLYDAMYEEADEEPKASAIAFQNSCLFGHTFLGSFGLSIEAPTNMKALSLLTEPITSTPERRASFRISNGIEILSRAAINNSVGLLHDSIESGLTYIMCRSLLELREAIYTGALEYETYWSPFMPMDRTFSRIKLDKKSLPILEKAAASIVEVNPEITIEFIGSVEKLQANRQDLIEADPNSKKFIFGVRGRSKETGNCKLTFNTDLKTYRDALAAHEDKQDIAARCTVKRRVRGWEVIALESFRRL